MLAHICNWLRSSCNYKQKKQSFKNLCFNNIAIQLQNYVYLLNLKATPLAVMVTNENNINDDDKDNDDDTDYDKDDDNRVGYTRSINW